MQTQTIIALAFIGIFVIASLGFVMMNQEDEIVYKEPNYKMQVLSKIVPIVYGNPKPTDIDTEINLQGQDGIYHLYASGSFPTEGQLFVQRIE